MQLQLKHITQNDADLETARHLFKEYSNELAVDLCFQSFEEELANPLKKYGSPTGSLILAFWDDRPVGTVALQALEETGACEMKRLYVQAAYRKYGIGEALVIAILADAKQLGYTKMKLDTLERLKSAITLYLKHGFSITTAYYHNPLPEVVYMEKLLIS
ncbi:MAG: GNAT family N-acetyltransferase [Sediminibacterium sp.]|nr:GNAT family N-acetyltransferase [Sediminibacterium sp.]